MSSFTPTPLDSKDWKIVPFKIEQHARGEYLLPDGTTVIVDFIVKKIKVSKQRLPNGEPEIQFQVQNLPTVYTKDEGYVRLEK